MWEKTECTLVLLDFCFILTLNNMNLTLLLPKPQRNESKKKKKKLGEEMRKWQVETKILKMENQWASKLFCSVVYFSFTNYKSKNKKMISDHFFLRTLKQSTILSTPGSLTLQVDSLPTEPPGKPSGKESSCQCRGHGFDP